MTQKPEGIENVDKFKHILLKVYMAKATKAVKRRIANQKKKLQLISERANFPNKKELLQIKYHIQ